MTPLILGFLKVSVPPVTLLIIAAFVVLMLVLYSRGLGFTLQELREKRAKNVADARAILEKAKSEKRDMTPLESEAYEKLIKEVGEHRTEITRQESAAAREKALADEERSLEESRGRQTVPSNPNPTPGETRAVTSRTVEVRTQKFLFNQNDPGFRRNSPEYIEAARGYITGERRALQTDLDTSGGYLVMPEQFIADLIKTLDDEVFMRGLCRKFAVPDAKTLGAPKRTAKMSTFRWGSELGTPTADTALKFGKRTLEPHYMSGEIVVSRDLLRVSTINPERIVLDEMARDAGELEENAFLTGNGAGQPLGVFTAHADGISTARDVSTDNTTTAITADGLINAKYALKASYRRKAKWFFHRDALKQLVKLKDAEGRYLWLQSVRENEPDKLLNLPFIESEFAPNTFTTGLYVGILGNFDHYWIADALVMDMQRLDELYARSNQTGFIARRKVDGAPVLEEAFVRVKLG